jgi:hypothetical protein
MGILHTLGKYFGCINPDVANVDRVELITSSDSIAPPNNETETNQPPSANKNHNGKNYHRLSSSKKTLDSRNVGKKITAMLRR